MTSTTPLMIGDAPSSEEAVAAAAALADGSPELKREVRKRRTFAIISHPDAGKTTLTEKLLLYAGCVHEAGAVRGRKNQRAVTSDWMQMERERGISVTSTVLAFPFRDHQINLLDTPGHQDFSEDTYRVLQAVDCAVMVLDCIKGVEPQTIKLFKICAARRIPIITFVNKLDRPGGDPLNSLSEIEKVLEIDAIPLNWPIGVGETFTGVYDRVRGEVNRFERVTHGSITVPVQRGSLEEADQILGKSQADLLREEVDLLDGASKPFKRDQFLKGEQTPVFFGSAMTNFGVEPFLDAFLDLCPPPAPRRSDQGLIPPERKDFAGVVFKIQANLDPRHRDRVAFVRVCAGRFVRDMEVTLARTGEKIRIKRAHRLFANERDTTDEAYAGDIIGMVNPGHFHLGDTLFNGSKLEYEGQWEFAPECFARLRCTDTAKRKQFSKGVSQLVEEGVVRILTDQYSNPQEPTLAAVGELQFDVVKFRLESDYATPTRLEKLPYGIGRWIDATPEELAALTLPSTLKLMSDNRGAPVLLFPDEWEFRMFRQKNPDVRLLEVRGTRHE